MPYSIVEQAPSSLKKQWLRLYLEQNGVYREIEITVSLDADIASFITTNFSELWNSGAIITEDDWLAQDEEQFLDLYRAVVRAGVKAARQQNATLPDISDAIEAVIATDTTKANQLSALQTMASNTTAAERDRFFLLCSFLFLSKTVGNK